MKKYQPIMLKEENPSNTEAKAIAKKVSEFFKHKKLNVRIRTLTTAGKSLKAIWIEVTPQGIIMPNNIRLEALKAIGANLTSIHNLEDIEYGNISERGISMVHPQWEKFLSDAK